MLDGEHLLTQPDSKEGEVKEWDTPRYTPQRDLLLSEIEETKHTTSLLEGTLFQLLQDGVA